MMTHNAYNIIDSHLVPPVDIPFQVVEIFVSGYFMSKILFLLAH